MQSIIRYGSAGVLLTPAFHSLNESGVTGRPSSLTGFLLPSSCVIVELYDIIPFTTLYSSVHFAHSVFLYLTRNTFDIMTTFLGLLPAWRRQCGVCNLTSIILVIGLQIQLHTLVCNVFTTEFSKHENAQRVIGILNKKSFVHKTKWSRMHSVLLEYSSNRCICPSDQQSG